MITLNNFLTILTILTCFLIIGADSVNKTEYMFMFVICIIALVLINLF